MQLQFVAYHFFFNNLPNLKADFYDHLFLNYKNKKGVETPKRRLIHPHTNNYICNSNNVIYNQSCCLLSK
jgi:hypothetical protein